ncbi:Protein of unknown function [Flavobacterium aquidurense]|uniref:DUF1016 N-terminal domain-containing protein n=1 Tax=Flavobacterium frigidimaris TaxID=262320 RepID=UPI00089BDECB|nr:DUF1016 N-terminal domain-containing protein [Flavobacterium frigidimaris]SDZ59294.1 Protein of unknown function [Flavobacterium aquidurense]
MADKENNITFIEIDLLTELSQLVEQTQQQVIVQNNSSLTLLFWQIGFRINETILQNKRAEYGKQIVPTLSAQLETKYGRSFTEKNLRRMLRFAEQFSDKQMVIALSQKLSWSHFIELLPIKNHDAMIFYANQVSNQLMSVR